MKKIALFLAVAALMASCKNLADNEYEITGNVDPSWEGKTVILEKQGMMGVAPVDTAKIKDAKFIFKDTVSSPEIYYISVQGLAEQKLDFVLEPGEIELEIDKDTLQKSKVGGTYNNDKLEDFKEIKKGFDVKFQKFGKANKDKYMAAMQKGDTVATNKIIKEQKVIITEADKVYTDFIKANPKAFVNINVLGFVNQMAIKKPEEVKALFDGFDESIKKTPGGKQIADYFKKMDEMKKAEAAPQPQPEPEAAPEATGAKVGELAPQFSAPTPDGKQLSLKQAMGKVTIIDFWASWCPPCRAENPHVVEVYNKYHTKGLNIIGVSLDKKADAWKKAISDDKLAWNHISNLKYWNEPIAKLYGVEQVPTTFILDKDGKIIAKDLRGAQLDAKIKELL
ncbi:TlpA disulfide reductase family protein [Flavobacterium psychrotrophum]|uniref:TlpA disulfide reductase family protein n=1 Tax=Flavobacterium psychrotrophum TaxID=2294119 RepID=UPI000E322E7C|nr:TlpA disulfide reductase family protein [Flavobacterium psychrotrophum]